MSIANQLLNERRHTSTGNRLDIIDAKLTGLVGRISGLEARARAAEERLVILEEQFRAARAQAALGGLSAKSEGPNDSEPEGTRPERSEGDAQTTDR